MTLQPNVVEPWLPGGSRMAGDTLMPGRKPYNASNGVHADS